MDESPLQKREQQPQNPPARKPYAEADIRASDADRDRVAEILGEALAEGRLDPEEHSERIDAVYRAKTVGALEPLVRDLPAVPGSAVPRPAPRDRSGGEYAGSDGEADNLVAVFSGASRKGRWRVGRRTNAFACFGGVELDLTEAVFEHREVRINTVSIFGGTDIKLPENVTLRCTGTGIFGGFDVDSHESADPDAPVVVITGLALFGGTSAKRRVGRRLKSWGRGRG
ncbi:DUF1707 domain-containing protein [Streptomyces sp. SL13]|uniref:DUF1707 domain-containing protein n=1 Tax=Streptantibioticus silvisoli TaxID=2705255 RepID=A0AA90JXC3_9ACTN|nr:DUF1707 domain-containing protein [Streptantibioticus silvisoli]MDI5970016.1 DUF1707 domain-containing protein [Streptantibioticus silvisoli]